MTARIAKQPRININTKRCTISTFSERQIDEFMAYHNDEYWMRYQGFKGLTRPEYKKMLLCANAIDDGMQLAITENKSGRLVGDIHIKREDDIFWVGGTSHPMFARQGYIYEAMLGLIGWVKAHGGTMLKAGVLPENTASISFLKKVGFSFTGVYILGERIFEFNLGENCIDMWVPGYEIRPYADIYGRVIKSGLTVIKV